MRGIGVLEDGFVFTEEELERGSPRFWWGTRKRAAFDRALARRGVSRTEPHDDDAGASSSSTIDGQARWTTGVVAAGMLLAEAGEKKAEGGGSPSEPDGGGASDSGGGSSDGGGGGSGE